MKVAIILVACVATVSLALAAWTAVRVRAIESEHPPAGRFVTVDGVRLHYTDSGEGPPIVLIHGASSNLLELETSLAPRLARTHRVLAFDRPGHGYSERGGEAWPDPARIASLILGACEALGAPRPLLVGHSWGGGVVMTALVREPERVAGGVLLAGVAGHWTGDRSFSERLGEWPMLEWLFARTLVVPLGEALIPQALERVFAPNPVPPGQAQRIGATLALRPDSYVRNVEDLNRLSQFLQRESTRYAEVDRPLLAIHGTEDEIVPFWNHGQRLRPIVPRLEIALLDGLGHAPHQADADRVAELIAAFSYRIREP